MDAEEKIPERNLDVDLKSGLNIVYVSKWKIAAAGSPCIRICSEHDQNT